MTSDNQNLREAFERGFSPSGTGLQRDEDGNYKFIITHAAWGNFQDGWKAALQPQASEAGVDELLRTTPDCHESETLEEMLEYVAKQRGWVVGFARRFLSQALATAGYLAKQDDLLILTGQLRQSREYNKQYKDRIQQLEAYVRKIGHHSRCQFYLQFPRLPCNCEFDAALGQKEADNG